ncbi:putative transposase/invertase (TIGR01784 family) [Rhodopirellula rubra]|uniref:Putative transposase/invertase (TIGR01784 family) n=1 Tax=Aporhodopirellula rubra TaxID=980271 RepID=A0A7W5H6U4_9BACT|nr:Rpn family recombination-promoting nuclease/putative transposase [Aporhodopirellula rubra]MBB3207325.1 putative transposase/invertase (TIGR01784 family) [Aporhodopirellula rubra]
MDQLPTPHNNFFHFALSHIPSARSLIESQLDAKALRALRLDTLRVETGSFVDPDLREKYSDLLFSVELADSTEGADEQISGDESRRANVYFLFEHKSQSDSATVLQLLSYIVRIWEKRRREALPLTPVIPLVIYHGEIGWTAARKLADLIEGPEALVPYQASFEFSLLDLNRVPDDEIDGDPILRSSLRLLKYSRSNDLILHLHEILEVFGRFAASGQLQDWITAIGVYVMAVNKNIDDQQYKQTVASVFPTQFEPGSLADRLLIRGREEGREKGREEGMEKGKLAGTIQTLQGLLGDAVSTDAELLDMDVAQLKARVDLLQQRLRDRP